MRLWRNWSTRPHVCECVCVRARVEDVPSDQMLGIMTNTNVVREI